jgi:hypothetical protein
MFARYFVELPLDVERVETALMQEPDGWVPGLARAANFHGDTLLAEVGFGEAVRIERQVEIELGEPVRLPGKTVIPLRWVAAGTPGLFPTLEADLEIAPLSPATTQLAMSARYVPPLRTVGRVVDRVLLSRVAEATLKDFLDRVGEAVTQADADSQSAAPADR